MKKGRQDRIAETLTYISKNVVTVLSKIIALIAENTAMFFFNHPNEKNNLLAYLFLLLAYSC